MYNETDLKAVWQAWQNRMKKYQIAEMMGITQEEVEKMLVAAREQFVKIRKLRRTKDEAPVERRPYFKHVIIAEKRKEPFVRPVARYDNKSSEERIEELLNTEV